MSSSWWMSTLKGWSEYFQRTRLMFSLATNTPSYLRVVGYGLRFSIGLLESPRVGYSEGTGGQYCSRKSWQRHSSPCGTSCSQPARNYFVGSGITGPRVWTISGWNEIALLGPLRARWCGGPVGGHLFLFPCPVSIVPSPAYWAFYTLLCFSNFIQSRGICQTQFHCLSG